MCTNDELKGILNDQVIPRLDRIDGTINDHGERIERLEQLRELDAQQVTTNQENIVAINDKLDRLPERTATEAREQIFHLIDERNLFYIKSSGRRALIALGAIMTAVGGAVAMRLFEVIFS